MLKSMSVGGLKITFRVDGKDHKLRSSLITVKGKTDATW